MQDDETGTGIPSGEALFMPVVIFFKGDVGIAPVFLPGAAAKHIDNYDQEQYRDPDDPQPGPEL